MKIYIEITNTEALDAHGFIAIMVEDDNEILIPISMSLQSLQDACDNKLLLSLPGESPDTPLQSTTFSSPSEAFRQ